MSMIDKRVTAILFIAVFLVSCLSLPVQMASANPSSQDTWARQYPINNYFMQSGSSSGTPYYNHTYNMDEETFGFNSTTRMNSTSSGPNAGGYAWDEATVGSSAWTDAIKSCVEDGDVAVTGTSGTWQSHYLGVCYFLFSIPSNATIDGIRVDVKKDLYSDGATSFYVHDWHIYLRDSTGAIVGDDHADTTTCWIPETLTWKLYGGSSDDWNAGLDVADINSAGFGVWIACNGYSDAGWVHGQVDAVEVTVWYHYPVWVPYTVKGVYSLPLYTQNYFNYTLSFMPEYTVSAGTMVFAAYLLSSSGSVSVVAGVSETSSGEALFIGSSDTSWIISNDTLSSSAKLVSINLLYLDYRNVSIQVKYDGVVVMDEDVSFDSDIRLVASAGLGWNCSGFVGSSVMSVYWLEGVNIFASKYSATSYEGTHATVQYSDTAMLQTVVVPASYGSGSMWRYFNSTYVNGLYYHLQLKSIKSVLGAVGDTQWLALALFTGSYTFQVSLLVEVEAASPQKFGLYWSYGINGVEVAYKHESVTLYDPTKGGNLTVDCELRMARNAAYDLNNFTIQVDSYFTVTNLTSYTISGKQVLGQLNYVTNRPASPQVCSYFQLGQECQASSGAFVTRFNIYRYILQGLLPVDTSLTIGNINFFGGVAGYIPQLPPPSPSSGGNIFVDFFTWVGSNVRAASDVIGPALAWVANQFLGMFVNIFTLAQGLASSIASGAFWTQVGQFFSSATAAVTGFVDMMATLVTAIPGAVVAFGSFVTNTVSIVGGFFVGAVSLFTTYSVYIGLIFVFIIVSAVLQFLRDPSINTVFRIFSPWWNLFRFLWTVVESIVRIVVHVVQALVNLV